jgi:hypothetical protein
MNEMDRFRYSIAMQEAPNIPWDEWVALHDIETQGDRPAFLVWTEKHWDDVLGSYVVKSLLLEIAMKILSTGSSADG